MASVTILRDTVTTSWSADDICFLILNISCWSDILVLYVFSSTLPVLACYSKSLTSLSTPFHDRLHFAFRLTRRVAACIVEFFSGHLTSFIALFQLSFIQ